MMTGVPPAVHGILSNTPLDPFDKNRGGWYYYAEQIKVPTLWQVVKQAGGTTAAVSWPVTVGADFNINIPEYRPMVTEDDVALMRAMSTPGIVKEIEEKYGAIKAENFHDRSRAQSAAYIFGKLRPNLLLLHLFDLDHDQHYSGVRSAKAFETLEQVDADVGLLRAEVKKLGMDNVVTWVIVSDHGFRPVQQQFNVRIVLRNLGYLTYDEHGKLTDWRVYPWSGGGSVALVAKDPEDREAIQRVSQALTMLAVDPRYGIEKLFSAPELKQRGANPRAFLAASAAEGFMFGDAIEGALVTPSPLTKATHGYDPALPALQTSLFFYGKGVKSGQALPAAQLIDVAPSVAMLLGVTMPGVQGRALLGSPQAGK
jgi:predicted AlkP superfamily pyrophosphatase or phosphodiesterase